MIESDIRRRRPDDLDGCVRALAAVHEADGYPVRWPRDPGRWLTPGGLTGVWVAVSGGTVVGHVGVQAGDSDPELAAATGLPPERLAAVSRLFVAPPARGHGLGSRLLAAVCGHADQCGLRLALTVAENGAAAIRLYERAGWTRVGSTPVDWLTVDGRIGLVHHYLSP